MRMLKAITANLQRNFASSYRVSIGWAVLWGFIALLINHFTLMNQDCALFLYSAERTMDGAIPYVDFYEVNPPLIVWINMIPASIAHVFGMSATTLFPFFVVVLAACSLGLTFYEIRRHPVLAPPYYGNIVFAALAQITLGCSFLMFGQREHLFLLLVLPYIVQSSYLEREPTWGVRQCFIALMAGLGFAIKPYFVIIWLMGECYSTIAQRQLLLLFRRTNWIIGGVGLLYCMCVWWLTPQYITLMFPMALLTYDVFTADQVRSFVVLGGYLLIYLLPAFKVTLAAKQRVFIWKLAGWVLAAVLTVALQHKGWMNHYYPVMAFGTFVLASLFAIMLRQRKDGMFHLDRRYFSLLWAMCFLIFVWPAVHLLLTRTVQNVQKDYIHRLDTYIADTHSEGKPLYVLSFGLEGAFPAINYLPATFPFHFSQLWTLPAVFIAEQKGELSQDMVRVRNFVFDTVTQDLTTFKPGLVVVDTNLTRTGIFKDFDFVAYFRQNPDFAVQWEHYHPIGKIAVDSKGAYRVDGHYTVYSRDKGNSL